MKNAVFWDVTRVAFVRTDISEEGIAFIIKVTTIGELETSAVTSNGRTLRRNTTQTTALPWLSLHNDVFSTEFVIL
jgi:hypothetical protein